VRSFPSSQQGFGLINAAGAWEQLVRMASADDPGNPALTSFTISTKRGFVLEETNGFRADVLQPGKNLQGEVWITRKGGFSGGREYAFGLRGDDGIFKLIDTRQLLMRNRPVRVRFFTKVEPGLHVAFLQLRDAKARVVMQEVPLCVRAPNIPEPISPGVDKYASILPPRRLQRIYVRIGSDVQAVRYTMRIPYVGPPLISTRSMPGFRWGIVGGAFVSIQPPAGKEPIDAFHNVGPLQEF